MAVKPYRMGTIKASSGNVALRKARKEYPSYVIVRVKLDEPSFKLKKGASHPKQYNVFGKKR